MPVIYEAQQLVSLGLGLLALGLQVWALVDAARTRADAYPAAGKRTKGFWVAITAVAAAVGFISLNQPLNMFNLAAVVGAAVFLADVRPALRAVLGRGGGPGTHTGPYGPW